MRLIPLALSFFCTAVTFAQIGMGQWRMHVPAREAVDIAAGNGMVYAALSSGVVEYDIAAAENRLLNQINGLSDIGTKAIVFDPSSNSFFLGYANGNIDQILSNGSIINIPAIKLSSVSGNKEIYRMKARNGKVYVTTGFGVVILDPIKSEVKETWFPTTETFPVSDVAFVGDSVYALTETGLYRGLAASQFLSNPSQWQHDVRLPAIANGIYRDLGVLNNEIYFSLIINGNAGDSIMKLTATGSTMIVGMLLQWISGVLKLVTVS